MPLLLLSILVFCVSTKGNGEVVSVYTSRELEKYLCGNEINNYELLTLTLHSPLYNISQGNICEITSNITIQASTVLNTTVVIRCQMEDSNFTSPSGGFLFSGSSVTIENLHFINCGTYLHTVSSYPINESLFYYGSDHAAVLLVIESCLVLTNVTFSYSFGFSVIGINLKNSEINRLTLNRSDAASIFNITGKEVGSGVLVYFTHDEAQDTYSVTLYNSTFTYNFQSLHESTCIGEVYYKRKWRRLISGVALTILYAHRNAHAEVMINGGSFFKNFGYSTGALVIVQFNDNATAKTTITGTEFSNNVNTLSKCHGAALGYYMYLHPMNSHVTHHEPLIISNTRFIENRGVGWMPNLSDTVIATGAVCLVIYNPTHSDINFIFRNCTCKKNLIQTSGACLYAYVFKSKGNVSVQLDGITASDNSQAIAFKELSSSGIFSFDGISHVHISGTSTFARNYGSAIFAMNSRVYLHDSIIFSDNVGIQGPAITIWQHGMLYFMDGLEALFNNNTAAYKGGAIYAETLSPRTDVYGQCVLEVEGNITLTFRDNIAKKSGKSIYATPIFLCNNREVLRSVFFYNNSTSTISFSSSHNDTLLELSTEASTLRDCSSNSTWGFETDMIVFYPGQALTLSLAAAAEDKIMRKVYSSLSIDVLSTNRSQQIWIEREQVEYILAEGKCTNVTMDIHSMTEEAKGRIVFSIPSYPPRHNRRVKAKKCPIGFTLKGGKCECSPLILREIHDVHIDCEINTQTISRSTITYNPLHTHVTQCIWMGQFKLDSAVEQEFSLSLNCPDKHCNINPMYDKYFTNSSDVMYLTISAEPSITVSQCLYNRGGTLCGECTGNLSIVFGSVECKQCPAYQWIWVTLLKIVTGPLLVYMLYKLQFTLTIGTLNGVIFYAQAANAGILDILHFCTLNSSSTALYYAAHINIFFLSILNLNLGFPLCFYNGMTELWKAGLSLLFPVYLLSIVVIIIFVSRFSIRLSNRISHSSVQVLVTVLHLSFSKLLLAVLDVLTWTYIHTDSASYKVWYWNGSVEYGKGGHFVLMMVTLAIALPLLIPYTLILIFSRPLRRFSFTNKYLRPALESVHAPYKQGQQYLFVARLILLVIMYLIYMKYRGVDVILIYTITVPLLVTFIMLQSLVKPFKNKLINFLDLWVMYNLIFLYVTTWYFIVRVKHEEAAEFVIVGAFLILGTAVLIILYHILLAFGQAHKLKRKLTSILVNISIKIQHNFSPLQRNITMGSGSYYGTCDEYRASPQP